MAQNLIAALLPISDHEPVRRNLDRANLLIRSLRKFWNGENPLRVFIVAPDAQVEQMRQRLELQSESKAIHLVLLSETAVSPEIGAAADRLGSAKQMVLKILAPQITGAQFNLILDSDLILCKTISEDDLIVGGRALTEYRISTMQSWSFRSATILNFDKNSIDFNRPRLFVTPQILNSHILLKMQEALRSIIGHDQWIRFLFDVDEPGADQWTEYTLYELFAEREGLFEKFHLPVEYGARLHCAEQSIWGKHDFANWSPGKAFSGESPGFFMVIQSILAHEVDFDVIRSRVSAFVDGKNQMENAGDNQVDQHHYKQDQPDVGHVDIYAGYPLPNSLTHMQVFNALSYLKPYEIDIPKIRIGPPRDGAYILAAAINASQPVLSYGIGSAYYFDEEMARRGHQVYMFDHTIGALQLFNERLHFFAEGVGPCDNERDHMFTIKTHIGRLIPNDIDIILKMDVEGAEWDVLSQIDERLLDRFSQITMEVHNLDQLSDYEFRQRFVKIFQRINERFTLFHVHGNNYCNLQIVAGFTICPVLELSFVKTSLVKRAPSRTIYPSDLDLPNLEIKPDHLLWFYPFFPDMRGDDLRAYAYRNYALPQLPGIGAY